MNWQKSLLLFRTKQQNLCSQQLIKGRQYSEQAFLIKTLWNNHKNRYPFWNAPNKISWYMKRQRLKQRLYWDVKQQTLSPRIYTRKKKRVSPLLYKIFYREFKQILIRHLMGHSKNFSRYTNFYKVNAELPRLLSPQMQLPINNVEPESRKMSLFLIRNYNVQDRFNKISFVKQYIIQRR